MPIIRTQTALEPSKVKMDGYGHPPKIKPFKSPLNKKPLGGLSGRIRIKPKTNSSTFNKKY